jgi:TolB-like protein
MKYLMPLILLVVFLSLNANSSGNGNFSIAIIDLEGVGADINQCSIASDKIRNVLLQNSGFKVMERTMMQEILREQGFQQTGTCNSTSCIVEAGQLLGVRYLLAGKLSRTEGLIALSLRVIDVRTGLILSSDGFETRNDYPQFLSDELPPFTKRFIETTRNAIDEAVEKGSLFVESKPVSGEIIIDGNTTSKETPATLNSLSSGVHKIIVRTPELIGQMNVEIKQNDLVKLLIELKHGYGSLLVQTDPPNAIVKMRDWNLTGTPIKKDSIPAGKYQIQVYKAGHVTAKDSVNIFPDALTSRTYNLVPFSYIKIIGNDSATVISLDGKQTNPDSAGVISVWAGKHSINVNKPGNKIIMLSMDLNGGDTSKVSLEWKPIDAYLSISTVPVQALIRIGHDSIGMTPVVSLPVAPGKLSVYLFSKMYNGIKRDIYLEPGQSLTFLDTFTTFDNEYLTWKSRTERVSPFNLLFSGLGDVVVGKAPRGSGFLAIGLTSDGLCGIAAYQYFSHKRLQNAAVLPEAKQYYSNRISEDKYWAAGTFAFSVVLRLISFYLTSNIRY